MSGYRPRRDHRTSHREEIIELVIERKELAIEMKEEKERGRDLDHKREERKGD
jgi:hypothetical protein